MSDTIQETYGALVQTLRDLGDILRPVVAARWEAPPGGASSGGDIHNPTLDAVIDPRRLALSDEAARTANDLRKADLLLRPHVAALDRALARWEGDDDIEDRHRP